MRLPNIGTSGEVATEVEEIFREWRRGNLAERDYQIHNSVWISNHLGEYPPRPYPMFPGLIADYVSMRLGGQRAYELTAGLRLGAWIASVVQVQEGNAADRSLLRWAVEKCQEAGLSDSVQKIVTALKRFESVHFPKQDFDDALKCQVKDSHEKGRGRE